MRGSSNVKRNELEKIVEIETKRRNKSTTRHGRLPPLSKT